MLSFLRISSRRASTPASAYVITRPCSDICSPQLKHMLVYRFSRWLRTLVGEFDCGVDESLYLLIGRLQLAFICHARVEQSLTSELHWVSLLPFLNFLAGSIIRAWVAFVVANVAIGLAFNQRGSTTLASTLDCCLCGFMDRDNILPVDFDTRHSVRRSATGHARILGGARKGHLSR